jgi:hypothetical protein
MDKRRREKGGRGKEKERCGRVTSVGIGRWQRFLVGIADYVVVAVSGGRAFPTCALVAHGVCGGGQKCRSELCCVCRAHRENCIQPHAYFVPFLERGVMPTLSVASIAPTYVWENL